VSVMVTGGTGLIGSRVIRKLVERGEKVVTFDLAPPRPGVLALYSFPGRPLLTSRWAAPLQCLSRIRYSSGWGGGVGGIIIANSFQGVTSLIIHRLGG
jgi:hypothetical protein